MNCSRSMTETASETQRLVAIACIKHPVVRSCTVAGKTFLKATSSGVAWHDYLQQYVQQYVAIPIARPFLRTPFSAPPAFPRPLVRLSHRLRGRATNLRQRLGCPRSPRIQRQRRPGYPLSPIRAPPASSPLSSASSPSNSIAADVRAKPGVGAKMRLCMCLTSHRLPSIAA